MNGMPGNISPPPHGAPQGGPLGHSVASVFHGMASNSLAPKAGHRPAPGPGPRSPGAPVGLRSSGVPTAPYGHEMLTPGAAKGMPVPKPTPPGGPMGGAMGGY